MRSLNRAMLIGHIAADPELRQTKDGLSVANFPLATNHFVKGDNGEKREFADFHRIIAWGKLGEICEEYLKKGMAVYVDGRIVNRSFDDKEGKKHYRTEIIAETLNILTWKRGKSGKGEIEISEVSEEKETAKA